MGIRRIIKSFFFGPEVQRQENKYLNHSYSQEGEDLVLDRLLNSKSDGFFVDVGAHDPKRFSNTFMFYSRGWRGLNIDALPGTKSRFEQSRPRDITIECGVSIEESELNYYMFNEPALNTFDDQEAKKKDGALNGLYYVENKSFIKTYPLATLLESHLPNNQKIDFLSIDVEGLDLQVLKSNDWSKYRPTYVLVEDLNFSLEQDFAESEMYFFMNNVGYELIAKTVNTSFYKIKGS